LLALVIFMAGVVVGSGLTFKVITTGFKRFFQDPETLAQHITRRMEKTLDLTDDQVVRVRQIILERQKAFHTLRKEVQPRLEAEMENTRRELNAVLTPEQARKWERRYGRLLRFWLPAPPGGHPPDP
jgi:hypothetical protein